jgi:hypothetical protein
MIFHILQNKIGLKGFISIQLFVIFDFCTEIVLKPRIVGVTPASGGGWPNCRIFDRGVGFVR